MHTVSISELRANILKYMEMAASGEQVEVTSHGRVLATLCPPMDQKRQARQKLDALAETAAVYDVVSPVQGDWDANS
jgi:prevent-host-death family protein